LGFDDAIESLKDGEKSNDITPYPSKWMESSVDGCGRKGIRSYARILDFCGEIEENEYPPMYTERGASMRCA
jgi:hypothetical protein